MWVVLVRKPWSWSLLVSSLLFVVFVSLDAFAGYLHCEVLFLKKPYTEALLSEDNVVYDFRKKDVFRVIHTKSHFYFIARLSPDGHLEMDFRGADDFHQIRSGLYAPRLYQEAIKYFGASNIQDISLRSRENVEDLEDLF